MANSSLLVKVKINGRGAMNQAIVKCVASNGVGEALVKQITLRVSGKKGSIQVLGSSFLFECSNSRQAAIAKVLVGLLFGT